MADTTPTTPAYREPHVDTPVDPTRRGASTPVQPSLLRRVSWGAIFAGLAVALAVQLLLTLLGLGFGLGTIDPATETDTLSGLGTGAGIWAGISLLIALFVGGFVASRFAGMPLKHAARLHGVAVWAMVALTSAYLATTAIGGLVSGATSVVTNAAQVAGNVASGAASGISSAVQAVVPDDLNIQNALSRVTGNQSQIGQDIRSEARSILNQAGLDRRDLNQAGNALSTTATDIVRTPGDAGADISQLVDKLLSGPDAALSPEERQQIVQTIGQRAGVTPQEAEATLNRWETRLQNADEQVQQVLAQAEAAVEEAQTEAAQLTESAMNVLGSAALWAFFGLLLALAAAVAGAQVGMPKGVPDLDADGRVRSTA